MCEYLTHSCSKTYLPILMIFIFFLSQGIMKKSKCATYSEPEQKTDKYHISFIFDF
jgi:hypothetical protein